MVMEGKQRDWIVLWAVWMLWLLVRRGCLWGRVMGSGIRLVSPSLTLSYTTKMCIYIYVLNYMRLVMIARPFRRAPRRNKLYSPPRRMQIQRQAQQQQQQRCVSPTD